MKMLIEKEPCWAAAKIEDLADGGYVLHYRTECGGKFTLTEVDDVAIFREHEAQKEDVFDTSQNKSEKWRYCPFCGRPIVEVDDASWLSF